MNEEHVQQPHHEVAQPQIIKAQPYRLGARESIYHFEKNNDLIQRLICKASVERRMVHGVQSSKMMNTQNLAIELENEIAQN